MKLVFRQHAIRRMFERGISVADVEQVLTCGLVIEDYPDDLPYPSSLSLAYADSRPLHVVSADNGDERIIITVYEPDPTLWSADFSRRVRP